MVCSQKFFFFLVNRSPVTLNICIKYYFIMETLMIFLRGGGQTLDSRFISLAMLLIYVITESSPVLF